MTNTNYTITEEGVIKLFGFRGTFMHVLERPKFDSDTADKKNKYEATILIPKKEVKLKKALDALIAEVQAEAKIKCKPEMLCLKDGDDSEYEEQHGHWTIKASNAKKPALTDQNGLKAKDDDGFDGDESIYSGGHYHFAIGLWAQNNKWGKRVNANLHAVKFAAHGERLASGGGADYSDAFDDDDSL